MCHHWQENAAYKLYEEYKNKSKAEVSERIAVEYEAYATTVRKVIKIEGSLDKVGHGFCSGQLLARKLNLDALYALLVEAAPEDLRGSIIL